MDLLLIARLYFRLMDFDESLDYAKKCLKFYEQLQNWSLWSSAFDLAHKSATETGKEDEIKMLEVEIERLVEAWPQEKILSQLFLYVQGKHYFFKQDYKKSLEIFTDFAKIADEPESKLKAVYGHVLIKLATRDLADIQPFLDFGDSQIKELSGELKCTWLILKAQVLDSLIQPRVADGCLERALLEAKANQNLYFLSLISWTQAYLFYNRGHCHQALKIIHMIDKYLEKGSSVQLAQNLIRLKSWIDKRISKPQIILVVEGQKRFLITPGSEKIDVSQKGILIKLLHVLASSASRLLSKEDLCHLLWQESYHPLQHDNKIYVTIKRLRELLKDTSKPAQIITSSNGKYTLSSEYTFLVKETSAKKTRNQIFAQDELMQLENFNEHV